MDFSTLRQRIKSMHMQHIYQPVMVKTLLQSKGYKASVRTIARNFLNKDDQQLDYYIHITKVMPGRVLAKKGISRYDAVTGQYTLEIDKNLTTRELEELVRLCDERIHDYEQKYGRQSIWHSKFADSKYVSGPVRFEVLKRAQGRCLLCGTSEKALHVDHVIPRNRGGPSTIENFQALCYTCNSQKMDKDDTDFRLWQKMHDARDTECPFCQIEKSTSVRARNSMAVAFEDKYPVTENHMLVSPIRHVQSYFDLGSAERNACYNLLEEMKLHIAKRDSTVTGFNVGINDGKDAGQTVMHCHMHLIPRRKGDVADPRGGIRHVIPGRGHYQ